MMPPIFLKLANGLSHSTGGGEPEAPSFREEADPRFTTRLDADARAELARRSGLKHAKHNNLAAALGLTSAQNALSGSTGSPEGLGVLCTGGPHNVEVAGRFTEQALKRGVQFVNPQLFPATLVSVVPTAVAMAVSARAFALALGHDELAFFEVLHRALQLVRSGFAERVLTLAVFDSAPLGGLEARDRGVFSSRATAAVGGLVSRLAPAGPHLELLAASVVPVDARWEPDGPPAYWVRIGDRVESNLPTVLSLGDAFTASGGVFCLEAARHAWQHPGGARPRPFRVLCYSRRALGMALLQWRA
ncbi:hypothetical protein JY651_13710 [Pyxidicoccus parkwayensis]|uniref:Beta-ketoacyl synthase N-terminal domain-containing protein n=1 Tax=Pyxidicoccus parkwayensis TaxID=2813578 RepID=A0ABX7P638_9BACT|nr:hypothetical protein [Pyxidicoccus parkwaysis]QSQ25916.1 hypothetical protein JY651_13710 [Pyxidicoccus parkwaysis]